MADEEVKETKEEEKGQAEAAKATEAPAEVKAEPAKEGPKAEEKKEEKKEVNPKFKDLIKTIEEMSVLDMAELVKALEDRFGVTASAPVVAGAVAAGAGAPAEEEEKSSYTVVLTAAGANKIGVIKAVREVNQNLSLVDAKNLVEGAPKTVVENASTDDAKAAKEKLEAAGATVELK